jgi:hypothetical protein
MPNAIPAADTGLPNLSRRSAVAKLGIGIVASTSLATASAIAAPSKAAIAPELLRLIEAHRAAYAAPEMGETAFIAKLESALRSAIARKIAELSSALEGGHFHVENCLRCGLLDYLALQERCGRGLPLRQEACPET